MAFYTNKRVLAKIVHDFILIFVVLLILISSCAYGDDSNNSVNKKTKTRESSVGIKIDALLTLRYNYNNKICLKVKNISDIPWDYLSITLNNSEGFINVVVDYFTSGYFRSPSETNKYYVNIDKGKDISVDLDNFVNNKTNEKFSLERYILKNVVVSVKNNKNDEHVSSSVQVEAANIIDPNNFLKPEKRDNDFHCMELFPDIDNIVNKCSSLGETSENCILVDLFKEIHPYGHLVGAYGGSVKDKYMCNKLYYFDHSANLGLLEIKSNIKNYRLEKELFDQDNFYLKLEHIIIDNGNVLGEKERLLIPYVYSIQKVWTEMFNGKAKVIFE